MNAVLLSLCEMEVGQKPKSRVVYLQGVVSGGAHRHFVNKRQEGPKMAEVVPPYKKRQKSSGMVLASL